MMNFAASARSSTCSLCARSYGLCMLTYPCLRSVIESRAPIGLHGRKGGRSFIGRAVSAAGFFFLGAAPLKLPTALGFTRLGSKSVEPSPVSLFVCCGDGAGMTMTSTSSAVSVRSAGKRRDVSEDLNTWLWLIAPPRPSRACASRLARENSNGHERSRRQLKLRARTISF